MNNNWAKETTTTTGTGNVTISASSGFPRLSAVVGLNKFFTYAILDDSTGAPIESGMGYLSDANTLVRTKIIETMVSGTYDNTSPAAVTLAAGTKRVICSASAAMLDVVLPTVGNVSGAKYINNGCFMARNELADAFDLNADGKNWYFPWKHRYGGVVDAFYAYVSTAESGKILRLGLYETGSDGNPGKLVVEGSSIDLGSTGAKLATFTPMVIPPGWYYISTLTSATTAKIYGSLATVSEGILESTPWGFWANGSAGMAAAATAMQATTAMPNPAVAIGGLTISGNVKHPCIYLRAV